MNDTAYNGDQDHNKSKRQNADDSRTAFFDHAVRDPNERDSESRSRKNDMHDQFHKVRAKEFQREYTVRKSEQRRKKERRPNENEIKGRGDLNERNDGKE